jgi:hypothetical protein
MKQLDLHGIRHCNVKKEIIRFIEDNLNSTSMLEIIIGNSIEMCSLTQSVLDEYELKYYNGGYLGVKHGIITVHIE